MSKKLDCVGVLLITGQVQSFYRQMRDQKFLVPTFGGDFLGSETEIQASGPAIEGAVFPDTAVKPDFRTRYKERFGNDIQISFAANAYDVAVLIAENFGVAGAAELSNIEVLKRLRSAKPIQGAQRAFSYEEDPIYGPAFVSPLVVRSVQQGNIHDVKFVFE
jgi:ABC-type branched-subunit amino acid transport system substrate-binding protein